MDFPKAPKIGIIGAGAIGGFYGARLAQSGCDVHFLMRRDYAIVREKGLEIRQREGGDFQLSPVQVYRQSADIGICDLVIVALKTTANAQMIDLVRPLVGGSTSILTLQNGMGNVETLAEAFGASRVLGGLCFVCINRVAPGVIENYLPGSIVIGEAEGGARPRTESVAALFQQAGIDCRLTDSLAEALWKKLCWNVPFNGLAIAGGGITTDRILGSPSLRQLARGLMEEIQDAASANGIEIPDTFLEKQFTVTEKMDAYRPSSLIDYQEQRPVEVESIWGVALRVGQASGVPMTRLETLYALLVHLTRETA